MVDSLIATTRDRILVTDREEHAWFCTNLDSLLRRLQEDSSPTNVEVISALLSKSLEDHWAKLATQTNHREEELKRIINLLADTASRLDTENKNFYVELRKTVQNFQNISQIEDITYLRKKLSEQVTQLQETVGTQETASGGTITRLQQELDEAHHEITRLTHASAQDPLTRLPARREAEKVIRELSETGQPFMVAMVVIERLDQINLRYGAECGDDVLRNFSRKLREQLPERFSLFRWGGPAFVGVRDTLPAGEVRALLQKVLSGIANEPFEVQTKGSGLLHITSKFAIHQWNPGQAVEKVLRLVEVFCVSQKLEAPESPSPGAPAAVT